MVLEKTKYIPPMESIIADSVECMVRANHDDSLVMISPCEKINLAMLIAVARLNMPAIYLKSNLRLSIKMYLKDNLYQVICKDTGNM